MSELSKPIPVRLMKDTETDLRILSRETSVPFSALIRLAVQYGLPELKRTLNKTDK